MARVLRHRAGEGGAFTRKYRVRRLVYVESFRNVENAIARETEIKSGGERKNGVDSAGESDVGGLGGGMGRGGGDVGAGSRFLTGLADRFGMTIECGGISSSSD